MTERPYSQHLDIKPGWSYLKLAPLEGGSLQHVHLEALRRFVGHVLNDHPYRLCHGEDWVGVAVGPPDAEMVTARLADAFTLELGAVDEGPATEGGPNPN